jgi:hypothetical protein
MYKTVILPIVLRVLETWLFKSIEISVYVVY